jgi:hypothetical protein
VPSRDPREPMPADFEVEVDAQQCCEADMELARLAALGPLEYDRDREAAAVRLGVRVSALDREVAKARKAMEEESADAVVEELEPALEPVGASIIDEIRADFDRYIVADDESKDALALWTLGTFVYDCFSIFPKCVVSSPEKRCGKTTTLEVIEANAHRALMASSITASALFRSVDQWQPTLIIDEADRLPKDNEELIGIINSGHKRRSAFVVRNVKVNDDHVPKKFSTWAPMVLGSIGKLADTIMDRAVVVNLRRKAPDERVAKTPTNLFEINRDRRSRCLRWAHDHGHALRAAQVQMPAHGNDRAVDNWTPLFAIAAELGEHWRGRVATAFASFAVEEEDEAIGPMLLADIAETLEERHWLKFSSRMLVDALVSLEGRPWCEWRRGQPMTANSLSKLLEPYKIRTRNVRLGGTVAKGYHSAQFVDACSRYIRPTSEIPPGQSATPLHSNENRDLEPIQSATTGSGVAVQNAPKSLNNRECSVVAVAQGVTREEEPTTTTSDPATARFAAVHRWLDAVGETDSGARVEVLMRVATDDEAMEQFLGLAADAGIDVLPRQH